MAITGGCRCGAVRYELACEALPATYACHCLDCQTWAGSAFALHALLPEPMLSVTGQTGQYAYDGPHGAASAHIFCATCATRIANRNSLVPGVIILRAGTLDRSHQLAPIAHIWVKRKQGWVVVPEAVPAFEETPTPEEFGAALQSAAP